jgi:hypothetical protein
LVARYAPKCEWLGTFLTTFQVFVFQEVYQIVLYMLSPFVIPISFMVRPVFCAEAMAGTFLAYIISVTV